MATLEDALAFHQRGWAIIPIPLKEKGPRFANWQRTQLQDEAQLVELFRREWHGDNGNVGVLLGSASAGIVDADLDWPEAAQLAKYFLPKTNTVFGRKSKLHSHLFYVVNDFGNTIKYQVAGDKGGTILELRGNGGQTVLPHSVHPSGEEVQFEDDQGLYACDAVHIKKGADYLAAASLLLRNWTPGIKDDLATAITGALLRSSWEPERVDRFVEIISNEAGDKDVKSKLKAQKLAATLQSKQGHVPGLPKMRELLGEQAVELLVGWLKLKKLEEGFPLAVLSTLHDFCQTKFADMEYIVEGLLYSPSISMLFAPRGRGKTYVAIDLALALALGRNFFSWKVPKKHKVWYVDGEMPGQMLQQRFAQMLRGDSAELADLHIMGSEMFFKTTGESLVLNNIAHQQKLEALIEQAAEQNQLPELIIFDNLSSMTSGVDENSNSEQDSLLHFLRTLRLQAVSTLLVHHSGKSGEQRGASRREDLLDLVIKLSAPEFVTNESCEFRMEFTKTRGLSPRPHVLEARLITDDHGVSQWAMTDLSQTQAQPKWVEVLRLCSNNPSWNRAQLADSIGCSRANIGQHLAKAETLGYYTGSRVTDEGMRFLHKVFVAHEMQVGGGDF